MKLAFKDFQSVNQLFFQLIDIQFKQFCINRFQSILFCLCLAHILSVLFLIFHLLLSLSLQLPNFFLSVASSMSLMVRYPVFPTNIAKLIFAPTDHTITSRFPFNSFFALWTDSIVKLLNKRYRLLGNLPPSWNIITFSRHMMFETTEKTYKLRTFIAFGYFEWLFDEKTVSAVSSETDFHCLTQLSITSAHCSDVQSFKFCILFANLLCQQM